MPEITAEILEAWASDEGLSFLSEDEDLMMADAATLPLLQSMVRRSDIPTVKRGVLLSAICVLVFDNVPDWDDDEPDCDPDVGQEALSFLVEHKALIGEIGDDGISDYLKEVVYPLIGLQFEGEI